MSDFDPYHQWLGIPLQEQPAHHYRLLGITDFEADREVISAAAERQTIYLRTMQAGEHEVLVAQLLNEVSQARVTLLNAVQKAEYDEELRKQQTPETVPEPTPIPVVHPPVSTPVVVRGTVTQEFPVSIVQPAKRARRRKPKQIWKMPAVIGGSVVGVIGVFLLVISLMFSGDADPVASNTAGRNSAEMAVEKAAADKAAADKAAADKAAADKAAADKAAADKAAMDKAAMDKAAMDKAAMDKAAMDKAAMDKAAMDKAAMDKAADEKAADEKAAMEKAADEKAEAVTAALARGDWKAVFELDAMNSKGLQMKATAEILARDPITSSIGMKLKLIPAGTFMMGSPEGEPDRRENERQHKVTISKAFYMQTTEVTQGQWKALMGTEPWKGHEFSKYVKEGLNYPAVYVTWNDAIAYCKKLSEKEGKTYRLPTEAEWEYACRAGTKTTRSFGNDESALDFFAWYIKNTRDIGEKYAHQVGLKKPNTFGLYDMHGNVLEWCYDYYGEDYYKQSPELDPRGPAQGPLRVLRGGSWNDFTRDTRSAGRGIDDADSRYFLSGFRVVRKLD
jgi:sulfatase modifying factor 1